MTARTFTFTGGDNARAASPELACSPLRTRSDGAARGLSPSAAWTSRSLFIHQLFEENGGQGDVDCLDTNISIFIRSIITSRGSIEQGSTSDATMSASPPDQFDVVGADATFSVQWLTQL